MEQKESLAAESAKMKQSHTGTPKASKTMSKRRQPHVIPCPFHDMLEDFLMLK